VICNTINIDNIHLIEFNRAASGSNEPDVDRQVIAQTIIRHRSVRQRVKTSEPTQYYHMQLRRLIRLQLVILSLLRSVGASLTSSI